ncbi:hypothetical protein EYS42_10465 [Aquabacterium lacunae]|uniref:Uncharacterized protein n=1 Tax=Aquabacterium lacunae TaxID=2528630 RepID=A0A4Q9H416_9BURK|nr:hypothetical protein EYS42_10465 [Aquabacterium lacunae]
MKILLLLLSRLLTPLGQAIHFLKTALRAWAPRQAPVLVPIPIQARPRTRQLTRRHGGQGD